VNALPGEVFVANAGSNSVEVFNMDINTGVLTGAPPRVYTQAGATGQSSITFGLTQTNGATVLYVTNGGSGTVSSATAAAIDGSLTFDPTQVYPTGTRPIAGSFNAWNFGEDDNALYVLNAGGTVAGFTVRDTGSDLTAATTPTVTAGTAPTAVVANTVINRQQEVVTPAVYVADSANNTISLDIANFDGNANLTGRSASRSTRQARCSMRSTPVACGSTQSTRPAPS
jgi:hypothetical protein